MKHSGFPGLVKQFVADLIPEMGYSFTERPSLWMPALDHSSHMGQNQGPSVASLRHLAEIVTEPRSPS